MVLFDHSNRILAGSRLRLRGRGSRFLEGPYHQEGLQKPLAGEKTSFKTCKLHVQRLHRVFVSRINLMFAQGVHGSSHALRELALPLDCPTRKSLDVLGCLLGGFEPREAGLLDCCLVLACSC